MKIRSNKALAVLLSVLVMLTTVLIPGIFVLANDSDTYNATLLDVYSSSSTNSAFGVNAQRYDSTLSGIKGVTVNYGWSAASMDKNTAYSVSTMYPSNLDITQNYTVNGETLSFEKFTDEKGNIIGSIDEGKLVSDTEGNVGNIHANGKMDVGTKQYTVAPNFYKFSDGDAVLFYVKMPSEASATEWLFQMVTASVAKASDGVIYPAIATEQNIQLAKGSTFSYLAKGTKEWVETATNNSYIDGRLGHIVFPEGFEGWVRIPYSSFFNDGKASNYVFRINIRPKDLGGDYTDSGVSFGSFMFVEDGEEDRIKVAITEAEEESRVADLILERKHNLVNILEVDNVLNAVGTENETTVKTGYTYNTTDVEAELTLKNKTTLTSDGSLIMYVKQELGEDNLLSVLPDGEHGLNADSVYYTINRGERIWTAYVADTNGRIALKSGFEGYILIPTESFSTKKVSSVKVVTEKAGIAVGTIMASKTVVTGSCDIKEEGTNDYISLYKKSYYNATLIDTSDTVKNPYNTKDYLSIGDKTEDPTFAVGIQNGYYYEYGAGSAENGEYEEELNIEVPPYTASLITSAESVFVRPTDTSPFSILGNTNVATPFGDSIGVKIGVNTAVVTSGEHYNPSPMVTGGTAQYVSFYTKDNKPFNADGAFMFYVDHSDSTKPVNMAVGLGQSWYMTKGDRAYFRFDITTGKWESLTTKTINDFGYLEIPAGFKGYIRIPFASVVHGNAEMSAKPVEERVQSQVNIFPDAIGGEYGTLTIGGMLILGESDNRYILDGILVDVKLPITTEENIVTVYDAVSLYNGNRVYTEPSRSRVK